MLSTIWARVTRLDIGASEREACAETGNQDQFPAEEFYLDTHQRRKLAYLRNWSGPLWKRAKTVNAARCRPSEESSLAETVVAASGRAGVGAPQYDVINEGDVQSASGFPELARYLQVSGRRGRIAGGGAKGVTSQPLTAGLTMGL